MIMLLLLLLLFVFCCFNFSFFVGRSLYERVFYLTLSPVSLFFPSRLSSDTFVAMLMNDEVHSYDDVR